MSDDGRMPPRRRIPVDSGRAALAAWAEATDPARRPDLVGTAELGAMGGGSVGPGGAVGREALATAVRFTLEELATRHPGRSVEVRVPPFGAVQCLEGPVHRRGTPPNTVETDADTWLRLATGRLTWEDAEDRGGLRWSGIRARMADLLPLWTP